MGMYNDYYKKYYSNINKQNSGTREYIPLGNKVTSGESHRVSSGENHRVSISRFPIFLNVFGKGYATILIVQCVVTFILFGGLIIYRAYPTTYIGKAYGVSLDYMKKGVGVEDITKEKAVEVFNEFKSILNFNEKKEAYISENYIYPVTTEEQSDYSVDDNKLFINAKDGSLVRASYPGKVKKIDKSGAITINYGDGIEMTYSGLGEVNATEGMTLDTNDIIGKAVVKSGNKLAIEIFYMGDKLNPVNCFNLNKSI